MHINNENLVLAHVKIADNTGGVPEVISLISSDDDEKDIEEITVSKNKTVIVEILDSPVKLIVSLLAFRLVKCSISLL